MDEPCSYEEFRACLHSLEQLNRLSLAYRPTLDFLARITAHRSTKHPLRIVDVGSGGGDMLRRIEQWANRRGIAVELTGIDLNPHAGQAACASTPAASRIAWITGDAFSYSGPIDVVISSLFTHHLADAKITAFLRWMEERAAVGWFINDLARAETPYRWIGRISRWMRWHHFVQHDGPVSFRRALREEDWQRLLSGAAVDGAELRRWTPARLCVARQRP